MSEESPGAPVEGRREGAPSRRSGSRRWPVIGLALIVAVAVTVISALIWADHYQPLSQTLGGGYGSQILTMNNQLAPHSYSTYGQQNEDETIWNEPAGSYKAAVQFTINNDGSFPITIDQVHTPWAQGYNTHFHTFFDSKNLDEGFYGYRGGPIFQPSTLPAHDDLTLVMHWTARCIPGANETSTITTTNVTYSLLGIHHTVSVPLQPVEIKYRTAC